MLELLVVVAIVGLLAVASVPVVGQMAATNSGPGGAAAVLEQVLSEARSSALARRSPVYVAVGGFRSSDFTSGDGRILAVAFANGDGTSLTGTPNASVAGFLTKLRSVEGVAPGEITDLSGRLQRPSGGGVVDFFQQSATGAPLNYPLTGTPRVSFPARLIEFLPDGTARMAGNPNQPRQIEIGLRPCRGDQVLSNSPNVAVVQIEGITGLVKIYRP